MAAPESPATAVIAGFTDEHRNIDAAIERYLAAPDDGAELRAALDLLRRHIWLEEEYLFPPLRAAGLMMPIMVMIREHGQLWPVIDRIDAAPDAESCRELLALLAVHNDKEEPIVYPPTADLGPDITEELLDLLGDSTMPDGWVCAAA